MIRTLSKQVITILTLLIAYLVKDFVLYLLGNFKRVQNDKFISVAIGMLVIVIVFYPLYELMKKFVHHLVEEYIKKTQEITNSAFLGVLAGFVIGFFALYCIYAWLWYEISVIQIFHKILGIKK